MQTEDTNTELGSIERELYVDAAPEVVYEVISDPDHVREWWPDEAVYDVSPGSTGTITFGDGTDAGNVVTLTVVEAIAPRTFSFRWTHDAGEDARPGNSLLVTFDLVPTGSGTTVRFTETGFREMGWEVAQLEETYRDHASGWDHFLPRLAAYGASAAARS